MSARIATGPEMPRQASRRPLLLLLLGACLCHPLRAQTAEEVEAGRSLFRDPNKGNCVACHGVAGEAAAYAATVGPVLAGIKEKFPERPVLLAAIGEQEAQNTDTVMPPYRRHRLLSETEIDLIARYLETL